MADEGRKQRPGQRAERLAVDGDAVFFVVADQPVDVAPGPERIAELDFLGVRNVVGNPAAFVARESAGQRNFGQQPGVGSAVPDLDGLGHRFRHPAAAGQAVVHGRETVQERMAGGDRFFDADGRFRVPVLPGVGVDRRRQKVGRAFGFQEAQEPDVVVDQGDAGPGLDQGLPSRPWPCSSPGRSSWLRESPAGSGGLRPGRRPCRSARSREPLCVGPGSPSRPSVRISCVYPFPDDAGPDSFRSPPTAVRAAARENPRPGSPTGG